MKFGLGRVSTPGLEAKQDTAGQPEENCLVLK